MPQYNKINKLFWRIAFAAVILAALVSVFQGCKNAVIFSQDFQWDAARALLFRINPYLQSLEPGIIDEPGIIEYRRYFDSIGAPQRMEANQFPSLLWLLSPLAAQPFHIARYIWTAMNLGLSLASCFLFWRCFAKKAAIGSSCFCLLFTLAGTPWRNQVGVGQHTIFSCFFFLLAVWISEKWGNTQDLDSYLSEERDFAALSAKDLLAGLALSISYFKYTLTAPLALWFIYKRRWKVFFVSLLPHAALNLFSCYWLNMSLSDVIVLPLRVSSKLASEGGIDVGAMLGGGFFSVLMSAVFLVFCLGLVFKLPQGLDSELFGLLLLFSLVMVYHRTYDFFVLIFVLPGLCRLMSLENSSKIAGRISFFHYGILLVFAFFGLRLFHESEGALIVLAVLYYGFTAIYSLYMVSRIKKPNSEGLIHEK